MAKMILMMGEKDGFEQDMEPDDRPDIYYAVPNLDEDKVKKAKGNQAKLELRDRLSTLAYVYDKERSTPKTFRMYRDHSQDRVHQG